MAEKEPTVSIVFTLSTIQTVGKGLMLLPYGEVAPLIKDINDQLFVQQQLNEAKTKPVVSGD